MRNLILAPVSDNTPLSFIADSKGSYLVAISDDARPVIELTFGGKFAHRQPETIDAEEFIGKKGFAAKGKKCSAYDLKAVAFGEPLPVPEEELAQQEEPQEDEPIDVVSGPIEEEALPGEVAAPETSAPKKREAVAGDVIDLGIDDITFDGDEPNLFNI